MMFLFNIVQDVYDNIMQDVFIASDNILSPLGQTTAENFLALKKGFSGIKLHTNDSISNKPFYASLFDPLTNFNILNSGAYSKFEKLLIASVSNALENTEIDIRSKNTGLIISSTKGNISMLDNEVYSPALGKRMALYTSAKLVADYFGMINNPLVISNACISGLLGILTGMRSIKNGLYDHVVVVGADEITKFVLSGFESFNAISNEPCRPFDIERSGITLGEGSATVILTSHSRYARGIKVVAGSTSNDANHISAPSRTGQPLAQAISKTLLAAHFAPADIDFISAHGTATLYNDEMEGNALTICKLQDVPVNSLKGYFGHTLGAAGLIESIVSFQSLKENLILPTLGYKQSGITKPLNISSTLRQSTLTHILKTASGFGGCNAVVAFSKL